MSVKTNKQMLSELIVYQTDDLKHQILQNVCKQAYKYIRN